MITTLIGRNRNQNLFEQKDQNREVQCTSLQGNRYPFARNISTSPFPVANNSFEKIVSYRTPSFVHALPQEPHHWSCQKNNEMNPPTKSKSSEHTPEDYHSELIPQ